MIIESLARELGSISAARAAFDDLESGMPKSPEAWRAATVVARPASDGPKRWLFILPENHSLAGIYPLSMAAKCGLDVTVRIPKRFEAPDSFLNLWIADLRREGANIKVAPSSFRIIDGRHGFDAILAYGDDQTIAALRAVAGCPVQGFGSRFAVSLLEAGHVQDDVAALARDVLSLGQTGCMSTRLALVTGDYDHATFAQDFGAAARAFWQTDIPWDARVALDVEAFRLSRLGFAIWPGDASTPLVATRVAGTLTYELIEAALATRPFTLPVLFVNESDAELFVKMRLPALVTARNPESLAKSHYGALSFQVLGRANAPAWDGRHEMRPLFVPS